MKDIVTVYLGRPIQPSIRRTIGEYLAQADGVARCGADAHAYVTQGMTCPSCHLSLRDYVAVAPTNWPEP